jgi:hypothetical protein
MHLRKLYYSQSTRTLTDESVLSLGSNDDDDDDDDDDAMWPSEPFEVIQPFAKRCKPNVNNIFFGHMFSNFENRFFGHICLMD